MSNAIYAMLGRQQGLMQEMQVVANNLANSSTTGYKSDRALFGEFLVATGSQSSSLSMGGLAGHSFAMSQGALKITGGEMDFAIQGDGFFLVNSEQGQRLTRAGHFQLSTDGQLVDMNGSAVLSAAGAPISIPQNASEIRVAADGTVTVSSGDGLPPQEVGQIGVVTVDEEATLVRDSNSYFSAPDGHRPAENNEVVQGALEQSNVSPVLEVARMIEVQRAYEAGQALFEREDQRVSQIISAIRNG
ncbi:flagellar hook-basal body complex protein [Hyphomonas adhaerens]|uniref:flagellar hook-basal body complex protein n=1 Tax=Hyphomonas adhaerens TaxID=81029 RepID=UPI0023568D9A|nr:flagellar hook-basal body complex protein [Hyphomonas adhaerens]|tara:strand:- start:7 stop:744 length:738 start_codon:yes stop_codon:yes gene_type:complete